MLLQDRRAFLKRIGISSAATPLLLGLPSLAFAEQAEQTQRKQRLIIMFSPNGIVPKDYWPDEEGEDFKLKRIMQPLAKFKDQTLVVRGVSDKVRGDGDSHMRGMSCLLTGIELFPGNIQGGSHTPAGWASGISIDQELKRFLQSNPQTQTRFGSLEMGVAVSDRADPWTRMVYAGANKPVAPIDDPYQMFKKMYGSVEQQQSLKSVLDALGNDIKKATKLVSSEDRQRLEEHAQLVRQLEQELQAAPPKLTVEAPQLEAGVPDENDSIPKVSRMQMDLLVNALANDMTRIATLQYSNSVGGVRMKWLGIDDGHHSLSHKPDNDEDAQEKLVKINTWFCEQMAELATKLAATPEPGGEGNMLDNTLIVWTNELGKGNSHTLDDVPLVLLGGGLDFKMGRSLKLKRVPHNRFLLSLAHAMGHNIKSFGKVDFCGDGVISELA